MDFSNYINKLKEMMTVDGVVHKRFKHSLGVADTAVELAKYFKLDVDLDKVYLAGLLHDCAKLYKREDLKSIIKLELDSDPELIKAPSVWHSFAGLYVAEDVFKVKDPDILSAIYYHTTGKANMTTYEKLIFAADYIEPSREGDWVAPAREACFINLDYGIYHILKEVNEYLISDDNFIYHLTKEAYDYTLKNYKALITVIDSLNKAVVKDLRVYDTRNYTPFYDYSIVSSASTSRQAFAAVDYVRDSAEREGFNVISWTKEPDSEWYLIDLGEIVVHVFVGDTRFSYNLDSMY